MKSSQWDDEQFVVLRPETRLFLCWARDCDAEGMGLLRGGINTFAEALRLESEKIMHCLRELIDRGRAQFDEPKRLLRLCEVPPLYNPNMLKGWFRRWKLFPESAVKYAHLESIAIAGAERWPAVWDDTFGTIEIPVIETTNQCTLLPDVVERERYRNGYPNGYPNGLTVSKRLPTCHSSNSEDLKRYRNGIETDTQTVSKRSLLSGCLSREFLAASQPARQSGTVSKPFNGIETVSKPFKGIELSLWTLQEELRAKLGLAHLPPDDEDLERVSKLLDEYSEADARRALGVYYSDAEQDPAKCRFFNGRTNWTSENFKRMLSMAPPVGATENIRDEYEETQAYLRELREGSVPAGEALKILRGETGGGKKSPGDGADSDS